MSSAWSWYVIVLVAINLAGCVWLIRWTGKRRPGDPAPTDTSHVWDDDLTELNQPMPRWWVNVFYLTIVFSLAYLVWYPGLGKFAGQGAWSSSREHDADRAQSDARLAATFSRYEALPLPEIARDPEALRHGQSVFANHCAACHGSDARGGKGFPDLTDRAWHWGGEPEQILESVRHGRIAAMPALGAVLGDTGTTEVAVYVQSLSHRAVVDPALASAGKVRFEALCIGCHGAAGTGNIAMGAPDLTDAAWLYGGDYESLRETITSGRQGRMPAHAPLIGEARARLAAAYVYAKSRPQSAGASP